ncbi:carbohydrate ABC transporter permease [Halomicrobium urmianum]|uniref:carbohydrate ABC transporter permease n=1 Tax=Halomicrobium urmianum TaxID=1586233 RepID=UPI001CD96533|nr:carbohydrate ABC transporter permease [Halomicrobium urmianum]
MATKESQNIVKRFDAWLDDDMTPQRAVISYAVLFMYFMFLLFPILYIVVATFTGPSSLYSSNIIPDLSAVTLENYVAVLSRGDFIRYAQNSIIIAVSTTILTLTMGSFAAYSLSRFEYPGRKPLLLGYLVTQMFPWVLLLIPFFLLMFNLGLIDSYFGIILAHTAFALPFATWLLKGYFDDIPESLADAGKMDGCSELQVLRYVMLPLAKPGLTVAGFYTFVLSWNDYLAVSVLTQTAAVRTLPFGLQLFQSQNQVNWGLTLTAATLTMLPVIVLFALVQEKVIEGLASGGMKGS